jgi:hypothetical protein
MFGYTVKRGRVRRGKKFNPLSFIIRMMLAGFIIGSIIGIMNASAKELYGASTALPYPLSVGDEFKYGGMDSCVTAYSWEDGSAVAYCTDSNSKTNYVIDHDPESNTWDTWQGCLKLRKHKEYRRVYHDPIRCYGLSLLSTHDN